MNNQPDHDRESLSGEILDRDDTFGCRRRQGKGDDMHGHHGHGRRERWHMKMGMGGGHRHGRGGRRGGRPLGHGDLRLLILSLISETPRHGYDLIQEIETRTGGTYKPSPGVMYPALEIIQDLGLAEVRTEDGKKTFHITAEGQEELEREAATVEAIHARLADLMRADEDADPADVRTAMHRLRHAVVTSARHSLADEARHRRIVAILSAARDEISSLD
ncbi:PadR family transcriptional regulator [Hyphomonas sp. BRH_c22]|uniref:PadR family transcriptional regulator n=1 Tax=Hyphomonas sp. BRH_c22 TaxID=1629710 RepID=UPI000A68040A|nr:PadR family transcriptional regulator [Hyphomonas sp. BRH_c22]